MMAGEHGSRQIVKVATVPLFCRAGCVLSRPCFVNVAASQ